MFESSISVDTRTDLVAQYISIKHAIMRSRAGFSFSDSSWSHLKQRFGLYSKKKEGERYVWIHLAGPGDAKAGLAFVDSFSRVLPEMPIYITIGSIEALQLIRSIARLYSHIIADVVWSPIDLYVIRKLSFSRIRPVVYIGLQGEIWPLHFALLQNEKIPVILLRSDPFDWNVQQEFPKSWRSVYLCALSRVDYFSVSTGIYASRLTEMGVNPSKIIVSGDYATHANANHEPSQYLELNEILPRLTIVWSSPRVDEIQILARRLIDFACSRKGTLVVSLPGLGDTAKYKAILENLGAQVAIWSQLSRTTKCTSSALLIDTFGILPAFYEYASLAIIGDTFYPVFGRGRNFWESLRAGTVAIAGPGLVLDRAGSAARRKGILRIVDTEENLLHEIKQVEDDMLSKVTVKETAASISLEVPPACDIDAEFVVGILKRFPSCGLGASLDCQS